jgi:pyruvate formate lyase activating enzyme
MNSGSLKAAPECSGGCSICEADAMASGYIHSVETCGTVDGPGLRYVLFLGGCPLRCLYCHNPDAQGRPTGDCRTADEVLEDVLRYKSFIRRGGLTVSGGEPLMQPRFVGALFRGAKRHGIHTALDTSGFLGHKADDALLDQTDLVLLDIKSWKPDLYRKVTGVEVGPTLDFAERLDRRGNRMWIRFVLVPGLTDDPENVRGLADFVSRLDHVERVEILPFHQMGEYKYAELGKEYQLQDTATPTEEEIERVRAIFADHGVEAHV